MKHQSNSNKKNTLVFLDAGRNLTYLFVFPPLPKKKGLGQNFPLSLSEYLSPQTLSTSTFFLSRQINAKTTFPVWPPTEIGTCLDKSTFDKE